MNELLPRPLLCWYATRGAGGLRSGNQLILRNALQYSDIMKFINIARQGLSDLIPDFCGDGLYDAPPTHVDHFLLHSGYSFYVSLSVNWTSNFSKFADFR